MKTKKYLYLFLALIFAVNCWGQNWFQPIQKAAKKGDAEAQFRLADVYYSGSWFGTPDYRQAFDWYKELAEKGYANPQFNLALMYYHGVGTEIDKKQAAFWMKKSSENGYEDAKEAWNELELSKY